MDQFATEEQQVEAIKRFWKENGMAIIAGAVIGVGGLGGWRYYTDQQITSKEQASSAYQKAVEATLSADKPDELESFVEQTNEAGYKALSGFVLAKEYVDADNLTAAADVLQNVLVAEQDSPLAAIAALRLASVQMQQGEFAAVLTTLEQIQQQAFSAQQLALKGDALVALDKLDEAKDAYTKALEQEPENRQVKMKLDNLALNLGA